MAFFKEPIVLSLLMDYRSKLIYRKVPLFIVRLLIVWYSLQRMHIRWGNTFSTSFCVSNGVKRGGIISPV